MYFPSRLSKLYKKLEARDLDVNTLKNGDVLQLSYQEVSCFPNGLDTMLEFTCMNDSVYVNATSLKNDGFVHREYNWNVISVQRFNENLSKLIYLFETNTDMNCSTIGTYTFKKKGDTKVYQAIDGSCEIDGLKMLNY